MGNSGEDVRHAAGWGLISALVSNLHDARNESSLEGFGEPVTCAGRAGSIDPRLCCLCCLFWLEVKKVPLGQRCSMWSRRSM